MGTDWFININAILRSVYRMDENHGNTNRCTVTLYLRRNRITNGLDGTFIFQWDIYFTVIPFHLFPSDQEKTSDSIEDN